MTRTPRVLASLVWLASLSMAGAGDVESLRAFLEVEDFEGVDEHPWSTVEEGALKKEHAVDGRASAGEVACFQRLGGVGNVITCDLPRMLRIGETIQVFCRVAYPRRGQQSYWLELGAGGNRVQFEIQPKAAPKGPRRLCWTEGKPLRANVVGDELALEVANPASEAIIDLVYLTTTLESPAPSPILESDEYRQADYDARLASVDPQGLSTGLAFLADFAGTAKPLLARGPSQVDDVDYQFVRGRAGRGLLCMTGKGMLPAYQAKGNFPFEQGTISVWFRPGWDNRDEIGGRALLCASGVGNVELLVERDAVEARIKWPMEGGGSELREVGRFPMVWQKGQWYHFAMAWDDGGSALYVDGNSAARGKGRPKRTAPGRGFGDVLTIGSAGPREPRAGGVVDEVALWERALTRGEIGGLFAAGWKGHTFLPEKRYVQLKKGQGVDPRPFSFEISNLIKNGSFEAGLADEVRVSVADQGKGFTSPKLNPELVSVVDGEAYHGTRSLRFRLAPGKVGRFATLAFLVDEELTYRFSAWVKVRGVRTDNAREYVSLQMACPAVSGQAYSAIARGGGKLFPDEQWQSVSFAKKLKGAADGLYYLALMASNRMPGPVTVWVDAVSVLPVDETKESAQSFAPQYPVACTIQTGRLGNIFSPDEAVKLTVLRANQTDEAQRDSARLKVYDFWRKCIYEEKLHEELAAGETRPAAIAVPVKKLGIFRALVLRGDLTVANEISFSVLPRGRFFAAGGHFAPREYIMRIAQRMGTTWNRDWDNSKATSWARVEVKEGAPFYWDYADATIKMYRDHGLEVLGVLSFPREFDRHPDTNKRNWICPKYGHGHKNFPSNPEFQAAWQKYVREVVGHFRDEITYWEVLNEPYGGWPAKDYLEVLKLAAAIIREANPKAKVVGPCANKDTQWYRHLVQNGVFDLVDVFSFHGYFMKSESVRSVMQPALKSGKVELCFDTEDSGISGSQFVCQSWPGREYSGFMGYDYAARNMARDFIAKRGEGVDVYFHYWSPVYPAYAKYGTFIECDGTLCSSGVAFTIANWLTDRFRPVETLKLGPYVRSYVFAKGEQTVATLWDERAGSPESSVVLRAPPKGLTALDVMGNPEVEVNSSAEAATITVTDKPVYLKTGSAGLLEALRAAKVRSAGADLFVVEGFLSSLADGRPALTVQLYNNDTRSRKGSFRMVAMPEGFRLGQDAKPFEVDANQQTSLLLPLVELPGSCRRGRLAWEVATEDGLLQQGVLTLSTLVAKHAERVTIDGDLQEWQDTPKAHVREPDQNVVGRDHWKGEDDVSGWVATQWDEKFLYIAIQVRDDNYIPPSRASYNSDSSELFLDLDLPGDRDVESMDSDDVQLEVALTDEGAFDYRPRGYRTLTGAGTKTKQGYQLEMRFPLHEVSVVGKRGLTIGFDFAVDDKDELKRGRKLQIVWAGVRENFRSPRYYGQVYFE